MPFLLDSPAFVNEGTIPPLYTCEGRDISPPLVWSGAPQGTKSFALIVDDPDAPDPAAPRMTWVHWLVYDIPATATGFAEGVQTLPEGAKEGVSDFGRTGYGGPCPPIGVHRYFFKLYALDTPTLALAPQPDKPKLLDALQGHVLGQATLMGTYIKKR